MDKEVFSVCTSPCRLLLHIWAVLKAVVTSVKNFRWALPWVHARSSTNPIIEGNHTWWIMFSSIPSYCTGIGLIMLTSDLRAYKILMSLELILAGVGPFINYLVIHSIDYWHHDKPFHLIGAKAKFMIELIPILMLAALHHLFKFNYVYLLLVIGFTSYFYIIAHFRHKAYDIEEKDVLLALAMQVLAYILNGRLLVRALALSFCIVLCFYRYVMYSAPELPKNSKKD